MRPNVFLATLFLCMLLICSLVLGLAIYYVKTSRTAVERYLKYLDRAPPSMTSTQSSDRFSFDEEHGITVPAHRGATVIQVVDPW